MSKQAHIEKWMAEINHATAEHHAEMVARIERRKMAEQLRQEHIARELADLKAQEDALTAVVAKADE